MSSLNFADYDLIVKRHKRRDNGNSKLLAYLKQILSIYFQERYQNFIPYYLKYGDGFIDELILQLQAFDNDLSVLVE